MLIVHRTANVSIYCSSIQLCGNEFSFLNTMKHIPSFTVITHKKLKECSHQGAQSSAFMSRFHMWLRKIRKDIQCKNPNQSWEEHTQVEKGISMNIDWIYRCDALFWNSCLNPRFHVFLLTHQADACCHPVRGAIDLPSSSCSLSGSLLTTHPLYSAPPRQPYWAVHLPSALCNHRLSICLFSSWKDSKQIVFFYRCLSVCLSHLASLLAVKWTEVSVSNRLGCSGQWRGACACQW